MKTPTSKARTLLIGLLLFSCACKTAPVPAEAAEADALQETLRKSGASDFSPEGFSLYKDGLKAAKEKLARERAKFGWFRNYKPVRSELRDLLKRGRDLLQDIQSQKSAKSKILGDQATSLLMKIERLKKMTDYFNESGTVRKDLSQAEIKLDQAEKLIAKEQYDSAGEIFQVCGLLVKRAEEATAAILSRYLDKDQLGRWKRWAEETIAESRKKGIVVIVVSKLDRQLILLKRGNILARYNIGLGRYGLSDKLYSGDEATPEGRYQVIKKIPRSPFYKALLINYPNEEDKKAFAVAKKNGRVPLEVGIGSFIEIHGGGKDSLTRGCVGLENRDMDEVYRWAEIGTPVTIVGTLSVENSILAEIKAFISK